MNLSKDVAYEILEKMLLMRRFEEMVIQLSSEKEHFFGHFHVYSGQEATGAPIILLLRDGDLVTTTHRNHGHIVGRGADAGRALAEIMGRRDGFNRGRGGTLHLTNRTLGFLSTSAVVGGSIGLGIGAAYALKNANSGALAVSFFGDGALEEGIAFESLNIAQLYKLPILFVCENNSRGALGAAAGEYPSSVISAKQLTDIADSLCMCSEIVDGADPASVYAVASSAMDHARAGHGPVFIEALTERWPGSRPLWPELSTGVMDMTHAWDTSSLKGEHSEWIEQHDPILRFVRNLLAEEFIDKSGALKIDQRAKEEMQVARQFAVNSPSPDPDTAFDNVFG